MSREILYITDQADDAAVLDRLATSMLLFARNHLYFGHPNEAAAQLDYAAEAPNRIPAGGCYQNECFLGESDQPGIDEYIVSAEQLVVERDNFRAREGE